MLIHTVLVHLKCTVYLSTEGQLGCFCLFTVARSATLNISGSLRHLVRVSLGQKQKLIAGS